ncbi:MAG TPA: arginine deiminase family protein [Gaiellaceae bacterium]|nr:arginine deiminase family protein [Gaiellaceae bacterium]
MSVEPKLYGCQSMTGELRRVLVRAPRAEDLQGWRMCGWRAEPDPVGIAAEHEAFCELLEGAGAEVVLAESPADGNPDAIYTYDPALVVDAGALLLQPGKECRRAEVPALAQDLERAGVPVAGRLEGPAWAEGGDCCWLDEHTLLAGCGYRTNAAGIARLRDLLPGVEVLAFDLPHWHGRNEVMHLMSLLSPLAPDLAVVYLPLLPTRLAMLLEERGVELVEVPEEEFDSMGPNVLALAPRVALAVEGNPETSRRLERAGVEVLTYRGEELSKGDGGPTCLTRPLLRVS